MIMPSRINTSLHRLYYRHLSSTRHKVVRFMDTEFVVRPDNYIDRRMWSEGGYEKRQLEYFTAQARRLSYDAFYDIGANFGLYSCIMGVNKLVPALHAFECDPRNLCRLYGHLEMNGLRDGVTVHAHALGDSDKDVFFALAPEDNTGRSHIQTGEPGAESIQVRQKRLDAVLPLQNQKLLIKIDVEGYEEFVLQGMTRTLQGNQCLIQIEVWKDNPELTAFFAAAGYRQIHQIEHDCYFTNMDA